MRDGRTVNPVMAEVRPMPAKRFLRTEEVAAILDVTDRTIRNWCLTGRLKGVKVGRDWRVRASDLDALENGPPEDDAA